MPRERWQRSPLSGQPIWNNATPPLRSIEQQRRYLGNRWILMSCGRENRQTVTCPGLYLDPFQKHAASGKSRHESILYTGHTWENNKCKPCAHNKLEVLKRVKDKLPNEMLNIICKTKMQPVSCQSFCSYSSQLPYLHPSWRYPRNRLPSSWHRQDPNHAGTTHCQLYSQTNALVSVHRSWHRW